MNMRDKLNKWVNDNTRGSERPVNIPVTREEYLQLIDECEELANYTGKSHMFASPHCHEEHVLFKGIPVTICDLVY